jgi:hypothetical protein
LFYVEYQVDRKGYQLKETMIFLMETVTSNSQKSLIPQQPKEGSPNQTKESNLKVNLNAKVKDVKKK